MAISRHAPAPAAALALLLALAPAEARARQDGCSGCVVLEPVATLDFGSAPSYPGPGALLVRSGARGAWAWVSREVPYEVLIFSAQGAFQRVLGGRGEGPGEYPAGSGGISALAFDATDTLWVFSRQGRRADLYGPDLAWARGMPLAERVLAAVATGPAGLAVVTTSLAGPRVGRLDREGRLEPAPLPLPAGAEASLVALASDGAGRWWVSEPHAYRVWEAEGSAEPRPLLGAQPAWFGETFRPEVRRDFADFLDTRGATLLALLADPPRDAVWLVAGVPSAAFEAASLRRALESGDPSALSALAPEMLDHVVLGIRAGSGALLGEGRFDYLGLTPGASHLYEVLGATRVRVLRPALR